jgi:hypothetical protein
MEPHRERPSRQCAPSTIVYCRPPRPTVVLHRGSHSMRKATGATASHVNIELYQNLDPPPCFPLRCSPCPLLILPLCSSCLWLIYPFKVLHLFKPLQVLHLYQVLHQFCTLSSTPAFSLQVLEESKLRGLSSRLQVIQESSRSFILLDFQDLLVQDSLSCGLRAHS